MFFASMIALNEMKSPEQSGLFFYKYYHANI